MVKVIYFDLETTGLRPLTGPNGVEIVQIGAICKRNKYLKKTNIYLVPNGRISPGATQVHGLTRDELIGDLLDRKYNNVFRPKQGLQEFMNFLEDQREYDDEKILLVRTLSNIHILRKIVVFFFIYRKVYIWLQTLDVYLFTF